MIRPLALGIALSVATMTSALADDMIRITSLHSVSETIDRLEAAVTGAGATVFARIDHAAGAAKVDAELRPTQVLIFGNPAIGTPAIQASQTAGLDLPLRVLAYQNEAGEVLITYHTPAAMAHAQGIDTNAPFIVKMAAALQKLTSKAVAEE